MTGPPGTGKTAFARYLARRAGAELIVKTAADILSRWVGGTEENLRSAFEEAEREEAILLFDEIDGILADRSHANRNWEVTQVNELLSCMETHTGIFLAATNARQRLDTASVRRFTLKLDFDTLDSQGRRIFWRTYLAPLTSKRLAPKEAATLDQIPNLTPADFALVAQQQKLLSDSSTTNHHLLNALTREAQAKNPDNRPPMGFHLAAEQPQQAKRHKTG